MKTDEMGGFVLRDKMTSEGKECHEEGLQEKIMWVDPSKQQTVAHKQGQGNVLVRTNITPGRGEHEYH